MPNSPSPPTPGVKSAQTPQGRPNTNVGSAARPAPDTASFSRSDWVLFFGIAMIWGSSFLLIAMGLETMTPGAITFLRVGLGALTLWLVRLFRFVSRRRSASSTSDIAETAETVERVDVIGATERVQRDDWSQIVLLSVIWVAVPFTLFPLAQQHINSAVTGLLNGATPVFAAIVSVATTRIVPSGRQVVGIGIGFVGLVLLSLPSINDGESQAIGVALVLLATLCYGVSLNVAAPVQRRYGAVTLMSWVLGLATVWLIPVGFRDLGGNEWSVGSFIPVVVLGVVGTGLAYWIMASLVGRIGSIRASLITYLIPVVSLVLGVVFRTDQVAAMALVGAALTTAGALLASRRSP